MTKPWSTLNLVSGVPPPSNLWNSIVLVVFLNSPITQLPFLWKQPHLKPGRPFDWTRGTKARCSWEREEQAGEEMLCDGRLRWASHTVPLPLSIKYQVRSCEPLVYTGISDTSGGSDYNHSKNSMCAVIQEECNVLSFIKLGFGSWLKCFSFIMGMYFTPSLAVNVVII